MLSLFGVVHRDFLYFLGSIFGRAARILRNKISSKKPVRGVGRPGGYNSYCHNSYSAARAVNTYLVYKYNIRYEVYRV